LLMSLLLLLERKKKEIGKKRIKHICNLLELPVNVVILVNFFKAILGGSDIDFASLEVGFPDAFAHERLPRKLGSDHELGSFYNFLRRVELTAKHS